MRKSHVSHEVENTEPLMVLLGIKEPNLEDKIPD